MTSPIFTSTSSSILTSTLSSVSSSISTSTLSSTTSLKSTLTTSSTSTSTSSSTISLTSTSTSSPTVSSTSTSILSSTLSFLIPTLCASAEWDRNAITVVSDLYDPYDIAIDSEDNLIVADTENHLLRKLFPNGTNITLVTNTKITSVFIDKFDNIYFTDTFGDEVHLLNSDDGEIITVAGGNDPGSELDQLKLNGDPGIYVDQNLSLYISDTGNDRVVKYFRNATSGIIVAGGHGRGSALNQLNAPYGIYVDEFNEIGAIYICDTFNHRIQKWLEGAIQGITVAFHDEQLRAPISILLEPTLDHIMMMYISSFDLEQVLKWIPYAEEAQSIIAGSNFGSDSNQLEAPRGIKFDKNWNLFVADTGNDRIQKILFNTSSCLISY